MSDLLCSVVVPSYNRRDTLEMVLAGLAGQSLSPSSYEVVVVLDGSTDDSAQMLSAWEQHGKIANLRWHRQANSGVATARNTGAGMARGPVIVFLDDDVVPAPDVLERHVSWHAAAERIAVLGDCDIVIEDPRSFYQTYVWAWWEDHYHQRALPGHLANYRDFTTGHVSLRRDEFLKLGGFDTAFKGYNTEDYELGYRLLKAGVRFAADRGLKARHYHRTPVAGNILRGSRNEGRGDVRLGERHPELRHSLRLMHVADGNYGRLTRLAMDDAAEGRLWAATRLRLLPLYGRLQMRQRWLNLFYHLRNYAYWCGVRDALGGWEALRAYQKDAPPAPEVILDISNGLPETLPRQWVDAQSPLSVTYRGRHVGMLQAKAASNKPQHEHMAQEVLNKLGWPLVKTFAEATVQESMGQSHPAPSHESASRHLSASCKTFQAANHR